MGCVVGFGAEGDGWCCDENDTQGIGRWCVEASRLDSVSVRAGNYLLWINGEMKFALSVGTYQLPQFAEIQLRTLRSIFGSSPLCIYDGKSKASPEIKELADRFDATYLSEKVNRGHFSGCIQNAVVAAAFAKANGCELAVKVNQRFVITDTNIPERLEDIFDDGAIDLAMPPSVKPETIIDEKSKFHHRFKYHPDFIVMRASAIDPQWIADSYSQQVVTDTSRYGTLSENFWINQIESTFKGRFKALDWLSAPSNPPTYLRKIQHTEEDYRNHALSVGMTWADFPTVEWSEILGTAYRPLPRA